jgi:hypothetical protein
LRPQEPHFRGSGAHEMAENSVHFMARNASARRNGMGSKDKGRKEARKPKTSAKKKEKAAPVIQSRVKEPERETVEQ